MTTWFLVTYPTMALPPWLVRLVGWPALRVLVDPNFFRWTIIEAPALGNLQCNKIFQAILRTLPQHNPVSELCWQFLWQNCLDFALICIVGCGKVRTFLSHFQSFEFTTRGIQSRCRIIPDPLFTWKKWIQMILALDWNIKKMCKKLRGLNTFWFHCKSLEEARKRQFYEEHQTDAEFVTAAKFKSVFGVWRHNHPSFYSWGH